MIVESIPMLRRTKRALELLKKELLQANSGYIDMLNTSPDDKDLEELVKMNSVEYRECNVMINAIDNELNK